MSKSLETYFGEDSILNFLDPETGPITPLVELPRSLNPHRSEGLRIFAKLLNMSPLGNVKSYPAFNMLKKAKAEGRLAEVDEIIESSSGNTVASLGIVAPLFGIPKVTAYVSHEVSVGKLELLRLCGVTPVVNEEPICPDPSDPNSGVTIAKNLGQGAHKFNPGQYHNEANPSAHKRWTGPQIWEQTKGKVSVLCAGMGTTGTIIGTSQSLKERNPNLFTVGATRAPNNGVPGVRTKNLLSEVEFAWGDAVDVHYAIGTQESYKASLALCRAGLFVGPSAGLAYAALLKWASECRDFSSMKNEDGEVWCVFICPDGPLPYLNEYTSVLSADHFPAIINEELLINRSDAVSESKAERVETSDREAEIDPELAVAAIFRERKDLSSLWDEQSDTTESLRASTILLDMRSANDYASHHLAGSLSLPGTQPILELFSKHPDKFQGKKVFLICEVGVKSLRISQALRRIGIDIVSIAGGMARWSELGLPRIRAAACGRNFSV